MKKMGDKCDLISVQDGRHGMTNWEKAPAMQHWKPELVAWLRKTLLAD
jgi:hypothetical protein